MLGVFQFAKEKLVQHWDRAPGWGRTFGQNPGDGAIGCLYTMVAARFAGTAMGIQFADILGKALDISDGSGFYWTFDEPHGRERVLQAIERTIARLEEHEAVPEGSDSNQVAPHAFVGCGLEPVT